MPDRYTATTITDDALDRLYAKLDKAQKQRDKARRLHDDYARRLDRVDALLDTHLGPLATRAVRIALDGDQPARVAQPEPAAPPVPDAYRAPAGDPTAVLDRIRDARQWADIQAQLGMYYGWTAEQSGQRARAYRTTAEHQAIQRAVEAEAELTRSENARDTLRTRAETAERRLSLAHQARRAKVAQLDDIKRALIDTGVMAEGDPYSHADLADLIRQAHAGDQAAATVCRKDAEHNATRAEQAEQRLAAANRARDEQAATIRRLVNRTASLARQLADMRKAYKDADALATLQGQRAVRYLDGACEAEAAADRYKTAWRSARKRARVLSNELTRRAPLNGQYATEAGRLRDLLRATEDDLADARRRLAQQATPQMCYGPEPVNADHPLHDLSAALRAGVRLDHAHARDLIGRYWQAIHDRHCTRQHPETP